MMMVTIITTWWPLGDHLVYCMTYVHPEILSCTFWACIHTFHRSVIRSYVRAHLTWDSLTIRVSHSCTMSSFSNKMVIIYNKSGWYSFWKTSQPPQFYILCSLHDFITISSGSKNHNFWKSTNISEKMSQPRKKGLPDPKKGVPENLYVYLRKVIFLGDLVHSCLGAAQVQHTQVNLVRLKAKVNYLLAP